jgi:hypothetical protein
MACQPPEASPHAMCTPQCEATSRRRVGPAERGARRTSGHTRRVPLNREAFEALLTWYARQAAPFFVPRFGLPCECGSVHNPIRSACRI